jgi:citronellol/citronellal dehydrogenase
MTYASIFRSGLFEGRVVLVTGGGTGIGRCIAHEFAALGAQVAICGRRAEPLAQTVAEITADGGKATAFSLDIRDDEAVAQVVSKVVAQLGRLDVLVNNAGGQFIAGAEEIRAKGWRAVVDTNLNGTFWMSQAAFRAWQGAHGGVQINIVADVWNGFPGAAHTGAARAGVMNLTQTLALEWASRGVRVNAVAPGGILSSGLGRYPPEIQAMAAEALAQVPAARLGTEAEVAAAVVFLASPAAAFITGTTMRVDGGGSLAKVPFIPLEPHDRLPAWDGFHRPGEAPDQFRR